MESQRNNEANPLETYRRLIQSMDQEALEQEFDDLQEAYAVLGHNEVFSHSVIDVTNLEAFTAEITPRVKTAEVEQKMKMVEKELELRGLEQAA
jgi:hypothetical protein